MTYVSLTFLGIDLGCIPEPQKKATRIVAFSALIFGFGCFSAYNAKLVSLLAVKKVDYPITNINDLLNGHAKGMVAIPNGRRVSTIYFLCTNFCNIVKK